MAKNDVFEVEYLKKRLYYDPETGVFVWRMHPPAGKTWNTRYPGTICGTMRAGYLSIGIDGTNVRAHRIAFAITYGRWPAGEIDHIDRNKTNNSITNLREAIGWQNGANRKTIKKTVSGFKGVFKTHNNRWAARIRKDRKAYHLGCYDTPEEAHAAYVMAANEMFGEFARVS